jgi:hypothetical protein
MCPPMAKAMVLGPDRAQVKVLGTEVVLATVARVDPEVEQEGMHMILRSFQALWAVAEEPVCGSPSLRHIIMLTVAPGADTSKSQWAASYDSMAESRQTVRQVKQAKE